MSRQFVACRFQPGDKRLYTFHNDGEPVKAGDFVKVETRGQVVKTVEVVDIVPQAPPFATAPVLELAEKTESWQATEEAQKLVDDINSRPAPTFD
jgi:hypothetical protein